MKSYLAKVANSMFTGIAKKLTLTGCWFGCYRPEAPEELFSK
jgi:cyclic lactone autoinducer peptide